MWFRLAVVLPLLSIPTWGGALEEARSRVLRKENPSGFGHSLHLLPRAG